MSTSGTTTAIVDSKTVLGGEVICSVVAPSVNSVTPAR